MARNAGGTYSAPSNSFNPAVEGTEIDEQDWNATLADLVQAINDSLDRTGKGKVTAFIDFAEVAEPSAPAADTLRLFAGDLGSGASTLLAKDAAGNVFDLLLSAGALSFLFDTSTTTSSDPGSGHLRFNNATPASVTEIAVDDLDASGADISGYVATWDDASSTNRGTVIIQKLTDVSSMAIYTVSGASTDETGWTRLAVTFVSSNGSFINNDLVSVTFLRTGASTGDVVGPASSANNRIALFNGTSGKLLKDGGSVLSAFGGSLVDDADAGTARTTLGISATNTPNTPAGNIAATNVQSALNELDAEKAALTDVRTKLTGVATLNVGSGQTYATLSAAIAALGTIDQRGFRVTIQIVDGTSYAGGAYNVNLTGPLTINGNSSTPANVIFTSAITFTGYGDVTFQNMRLATTTGANLTLDGPGVTLRFGAGMEFYGTPSTSHILIQNGATFANDAGGFTLGSGALRWLWATNGARIAFSNFTLTTANTPAWSGEGIYLADGAVMTMFNVTMAGTGATGKRYTVEYPGMLNSFGAGTPSTYYPGSTDGTHIVALGFSTTSVSLGTISSGTVTPNPHVGGVQHYTNNGAHTLAPPVSTYHGSMVVDITNGASAGAITTSGFTKVAGDSFTTTNGHKFRCVISVGNAGSLLQVQAMQ